MAQIIAVFFIITLYLIYPDSSQAAYLIQLKNGREFITSRYWVEGNQVMFHTNGGVFGIAKELIRKIEQSDRPSGSEAVAGPLPAQRAEVKPEKAETKKVDEPASAPKEPPKKNEEIVAEFRLLQKKFGQLNDLPNFEVYALSGDLNAFKKKVLSGNLADDHKDELSAANAMIRAIEGYLKAGTR